MEGSTPPTPPENKEPTLQEVQEIALEASKVAAEAKTAAEAKKEVKESIQKESAERDIALSDEDAQRIADATIAGLEARGAFEPAPEPTPEPNPTPAEASASGDTSAPTPPAPESSPAPPAQPETPPRKRTFAERFVGRN